MIDRPGETRGGQILRIAEVSAALAHIKRRGGVTIKHAQTVAAALAVCDEGRKLLADWWRGCGLPGRPAAARPLGVARLLGLARGVFGWDGSLPFGSPEDRQLIEDQQRRQLNDANRRWAIVNIEGKAAFVERTPDRTQGGWVLRYSTVSAAKEVFRPQKIPALNEKTTGGVAAFELTWPSLFDEWQRMRTRRTYHDVGFNPVPGLINQAGGDLPQGDTLELYQGLTIAPRPGECGRILAHIREVWCSGDPTATDYVLDWMARMFQQPGTQGRTAIVLRSGEGTGKNIVVDILTRAFGRHGVTVTRANDVLGQFNDHLATAVCVLLNEATWGGDKASEGALKALVTDNTLGCERKYVPRFEVKNCTHLIIASNNDWVIPAGMDDRRYFVLDVAEHRKGDAAYFDALVAEIRDGGDAAFVGFLLDRDIKGFNPAQIPRGLDCATSSYTEQKLRTAATTVQWWAHAVEVGEVYRALVEDERWSEPHEWKHDVTEEPGRLSKAEAYAAYVEWCRAQGKRSELIGPWAKALQPFGVRTGPGIKRRDDDSGDREYAIEVPAINEARDTFNNIIGGQFFEKV